ncbi:MAG: dihydroorotate dehydrogenase [Bacillota bacterium]|nr:dihydroorotate dehydrogenase [Bacillota bacterium]
MSANIPPAGADHWTECLSGDARRLEAELASLRAQIDLCCNLGGLQLGSPVLVASGTYGFGREYGALYSPALLGAVCTKCVTLEPRAGNVPPRVTETPAGMLNSIGLENPGVDVFLREELPWLRDQGARVVVNIAGHTVAEYGRLTARLDGTPGIAGLEVNVSCPNVDRGGMAFGVSAKSTEAVMRVIRKETSLPLICKLTPNVTDVTEIARAAEESGADVLSLINTLLGMAIDIETRRPVIGNTFGGLSGPAVKPVALRMVWQVRQAVKLPLLGLGGIACAEDAVEFILAGASAVAVGSGTFSNPLLPLEVTVGLGGYLKRTGLRLADAVGLAHRPQGKEATT